MNIKGETKGARELGYKGKNTTYIWSACVDCGKERWVQLSKSCLTQPKGANPKCRHCANKLHGIQMKGKLRKENNPNWKGGKYIDNLGYIRILLQPDDFFYSMTNSTDYVREHRLVMAKHLGRNLHSWEIVHHKHTRYPIGTVEDKQDNRIENLQLVTDERHKQITILETRIKYLEQRVTLLEAQNTLLEQGTARTHQLTNPPRGYE